MRKLFFIRLLSILTILLLVSNAVADIYDPGPDVELSFANSIGNDTDVLGTPSIRKTAALVAEFNNENDKGEKRLGNGLSSLKEIVFYARQKLNSKPDLEDKLLKSIERVWYNLSSKISENDPLMRPTNWIINPDDFQVILIPDQLVLDFKATYLDRVAQSADFYREAIDTLGILLLTQHTLEYVIRKDAVDKVGTVAEERKKQWQVYFDESIPQWPWELLLVNGPIYGHKLKNEKGLGTLPDWQMVVLHPDIALEYVDRASDGDQFKPALMVEILGVDFWSWKDGGKQRGPWGLPVPLGAGFVASYSDRADINDWGFGGVIHINHIYNIGATFHESDVGFFVSINIAKLLEDKRKKADKYFNLVGLSASP